MDAERPFSQTETLRWADARVFFRQHGLVATGHKGPLPRRFDLQRPNNPTDGASVFFLREGNQINHQELKIALSVFGLSYP